MEKAKKKRTEAEAKRKEDEKKKQEEEKRAKMKERTLSEDEKNERSLKTMYEVAQREKKTVQERADVADAEQSRINEDNKRRQKEAEDAKKKKEILEKELLDQKHDEQARIKAPNSVVIHCFISDEAKEAINKIQNSTENKHSAAMLKCNAKTGEVELVSYEEASALEKLAEEMPNGSPRFIVYKYSTSIDISNNKKTLLMLIYYNPLNLNIALKNMYQTSKDALLKEFVGLKPLDVSSLDDLTDAKLRSKMLGVGGRL